MRTIAFVMVAYLILYQIARANPVREGGEAPVPALFTTAAEPLSLRSREWMSPSDAEAAWRRFLIDPVEVRLFEIRTGMLVGFIPRTRPMSLYPGFLAPPDLRLELDLRPAIPQPRSMALNEIIGPLPEAVEACQCSGPGSSDASWFANRWCTSR